MRVHARIDNRDAERDRCAGLLDSQKAFVPKPTTGSIWPVDGMALRIGAAACWLIIGLLRVAPPGIIRPCRTRGSDHRFVRPRTCTAAKLPVAGGGSEPGLRRARHVAAASPAELLPSLPFLWACPSSSACHRECAALFPGAWNMAPRREGIPKLKHIWRTILRILAIKEFDMRKGGSSAIRRAHCRTRIRP